MTSVTSVAVDPRTRARARVDTVATLDAEFTALSRPCRAGAPHVARTPHPNLDLDPTALPLLAELGTSGPLRPTELVRRLHLDPWSTAHRRHGVRFTGRDRDPDRPPAAVARRLSAGAARWARGR